VANWSGEWPGLVGMLNLNASLTKAGVAYSSLWSADFTDEFFLTGLRRWLAGEPVRARYQPRAPAFRLPAAAAGGRDRRAPGRRIAARQGHLGVFDEGCMGMYNAIIPDELLHPTGVFKERLSQSALYAEMLAGGDEARQVRAWLDRKGVQFR
jgi:hypothetical protein